MTRTQYLRVPTESAERYADMIRYMGYARYAERPDGSTDYGRYDRFVPETPDPIVVGTKNSYPHLWSARTTLHRITETERSADGTELSWTYFRKPSCLNNQWGPMNADRWRSFGVKAEVILR